MQIQVEILEMCGFDNADALAERFHQVKEKRKARQEYQPATRKHKASHHQRTQTPIEKRRISLLLSECTEVCQSAIDFHGIWKKNYMHKSYLATKF